MKNLYAAACLCLVPVTAHAQGFEGATVGLTYQAYEEDGFTYDTAEITADAGYLASAMFGVQVGLGYSIFIDSNDVFASEDGIGNLELHGFYVINPNARAGLMLSFDGFDDGQMTYAVEALYADGDLRAEGRVARSEGDFESLDFYEAEASYVLDNGLGIHASLQRLFYDDDAGFFYTNALGVSYDVAPQARLFVDYAWTENNFGGGSPTFEGQRILLGVEISLGGPRNDRLFSYDPFIN